MNDDPAIAEAILRLTAARGADRSICPTEAAQALDPQAWRSRLTDVRRVAATLARAGRIDILRKGRPIDPAEIRGVIRLRLRADGRQDEGPDGGDEGAA